MGLPLHLGVRDANLALGGVLIEHGDLSDAAPLYDDAIEMAERRGWMASAAVTGVARSRLDAAVAGPAAGLARIERVRLGVAAHPMGRDGVRAVDAVEAQLRIQTGDLARAGELVAGLRPGLRRRLLESRLALARGATAAAAAALAGVTPVHVRDRLEADLLRARLAVARNDHGAADEHVRAAAELGLRHGFRRSFLDEGPELVHRLHRLAARHGELALLVDEIDALPATTGHGVAEALTEREQSVLRFLQSRLTHQEIAHQLGISANTLKTHTRTLYRKLGVTSRAEALAAAGRAGLVRSPGEP
jgi:LuxR family maltose regulon positive regulatory protein